MTRPLLGIVACTRQFEDETIHRVIERYLTAPLRWAGVDVVIVPALADLSDTANLAARLDGLLLTGSTSNMEPWRYGAGTTEGPFDPPRDAIALDLAARMIDAARPVFGICRGFQELNVLFGGSLQHLPPERQALHHAPPGAAIPDLFAHVHAVHPVPGGQLADALGTAPITVNSVHFQAVARLADDLVAEAHADDGLVEAFRARATPAPVLAVQWHPEWDADGNPQSRWFFTALGRALGANPPRD